MSNTIAKLEQAMASLNPVHLNIQDDSTLHAGHAGNTGGGHYTLTIVSEAFEGLMLLKRHRLVNEAAKELLSSEIHALSISAKTPTEFDNN
jgi:BolA protein